MTEEIILGDYKISFYYMFTRNANILYAIYLHDKQVGWVYFVNDMPTLDTVWSNDTDLITILLLRYNTTPYFKIYPFNNRL